MTPTQIECFLTAAQCKSFTAAADRLFRSVPSVIRHVQHLEKELNCTLFLKSTAGITLTEAGKECYDFFFMYMKQLKKTLTAMEYTTAVLEQQFSVGVSPWIDTTGAISKGLKAAAKQYAHTDFQYLQIPNTELLHLLETKELDLAIMCDSQITDHARFCIQRIAPENLCLYVPQNSGEQKSSFLPLLDASYGPWNKQLWNVISDRLQKKHLNLIPDGHFHMPNHKSVLYNVENHCGIAVCDAHFGYLAGNSTLTSYPISMESYICCVWNEENDHPLIRKITDFLKSFYLSEDSLP